MVEAQGVDIALLYVIAVIQETSLSHLHASTLLRLSGCVIFGVLLWLTGFVVSTVLKKPSLGLGDVKFYAVAGIWLGITYLPDFMFLCGLLGLLWGGVYKSLFKTERFPFGPALIVAFYIGLLLQGAQLHFLSYNQ